MWTQFLIIEEPKLVAIYSDSHDAESSIDIQGLSSALQELGADTFKIDDEAVKSFIGMVHSGEPPNNEKVEIGCRLDALVEVEMQNHDLLAVLKVTAPYGGKSLSPVMIMQALAKAHVTKGINKRALNKALVDGKELKPGQTLTQPIAQGKQPIPGKDARFVSLTKDFRSKVLSPQVESTSKSGKVDLKDFGEQITVAPGDVLMKRIPATPGTAGYTVTGATIPAKAGKDIPYGQFAGSLLAKKDPAYMIAARNGLPKIRDNGVDVDDALILKSVSVATGHIGFKGDVVVEGNIEPGMVVKATGDVQVTGYIESATVQAHGTVTVAKGIIGQVAGGESNCKVTSKKGVVAAYALNAQIKSGQDIELALHCINGLLTAKGDITVLNQSKNRGLVSGGELVVGGKLLCSQLGSEGDAATEVQMFGAFKQHLVDMKEAKKAYTKAQEATMEVVRKELELKKTPKAQRSEEAIQDLDALRQQNEEQLAAAKKRKDNLESTLNEHLENCTVEVLDKVYTHVSIYYGEEVVTTKNEHDYSLFSFDKYQIDRQSIKPE